MTLRKQACWAHWLMVVQVLLSVATIIAVLLWLRSDWREYLPWNLIPVNLIEIQSTQS